MSKTKDQLAEAFKEGKKAIVALMVEKERLAQMAGTAVGEQSKSLSDLIATCDSRIEELTKDVAAVRSLYDQAELGEQIETARTRIEGIVEQLPNFAKLLRKGRG